MELYLPKFKRRVLSEKTDGKEDMFLFLTEDLKYKVDSEKYPNAIFLFKNEELWFEIYKKQDEKNGYFYCSYRHYWSVFEREFGLKYAEIQELTKNMVETHFKLSRLTPKHFNNRSMDRVETHFKLSRLTPRSKSKKTVAG